MLQRLVLCVLLALSASIATRLAIAEDRPAEIAAAQQIITDQLAAFARDDGAAAYAFAAPEIKAKFPTPEIFMMMVKKGYAPVYRPRSYDFTAGEILANGVVRQEVDLLTAEGEAWTAEYMLQHQADGSFKIISCRLTKKPGVGA